jgi:hypothetical protein
MRTLLWISSLAFIGVSAGSYAQSLSRAEFYLRESQIALQRGETRMACEMAELAIEFGKGTERQQERMCGRLAVEDTQRRQEAERQSAQFEKEWEARRREEERRSMAFCRGRPSFRADVLEDLANRLRSSPNALSMQRIRLEEGLCRAVMYHPKGSIECTFEFDSRGVVQVVRGCP